MGAGAFNRHRNRQKQRLAMQRAAREEFEARPVSFSEQRSLADDEFPMEIPPKVTRAQPVMHKPLPKPKEPRGPKSKKLTWRSGNK